MTALFGAANQRQQLRMDGLVSRADGACRQHVRRAVGIGDVAAGLLDDQNAGCDVPGLQFPLPESIVRTLRDEAEVDEKALLTLALVENLQRSDLNPIEEGEGYQQLMTMQM